MHKEQPEDLEITFNHFNRIDFSASYKIVCGFSKLYFYTMQLKCFTHKPWCSYAYFQEGSEYSIGNCKLLGRHGNGYCQIMSVLPHRKKKPSYSLLATLLKISEDSFSFSWLKLNCWIIITGEILKQQRELQSENSSTKY